ncbi:MAG: hypothetical protein IAF38_19875, partial [Bacteroidia bacterium]|nr:hypothetical protein [Bacteroidia bacterium]
TTGSSALTVNTGNINAKGDLSIAATSTTSGGTATITINGTGTQSFSGNATLGGGRLPHVVINKSSGTLTLSNTISLGGNWTYTAGNTNAGTSTLAPAVTCTLTGTDTLYNVKLPGTAAATVTIAAGTTVTTTGTLTMQGTNSIVLNTGTIDAKGDITSTNTSTVTTSGGSATINVCGAGTQTFTGSVAAATGFFPKIIINKPSGTLNLAGIISSNNDWTYTLGTVDAATTNTVYFRGTANLDGQGTSQTMKFYHVTFGASNRTLTGNLRARGDLTIAATTTLTASSYDVNVGRSWTQTSTTGTFSVTTGTVTFDSTSYGLVTRNSGSSTVTFPRMVMNKAGGAVTLASPLNVTTSLTMTKGKLKTSATNFIELSDNATCTGGSDTAYVHGPFRKTGNDVFTFPLGDTTLTSYAYHPLGMTAPSSATDKFAATYFASAQTKGSGMLDSLEGLSNCEYWKLDSLVGNSDVTVKLNWNGNACNIYNYNDFRVAAWNGSNWADRGGVSLFTSGSKGSITSNGAITLTYPIHLVIGIKKAQGPYATLRKKADGGFYNVSNNRLTVRFEDEYANKNHTLDVKIWNESHTDVYPLLMNHSLTAELGDVRLKFDLFQSGYSPLATGAYLMEVTNEKNEKQFLKFRIP